MKRKTVIGIVLTKSCNATCSHCITSSSPKAGETCTEEELEEWIGKVAAYHSDGQIAFTGGEVFYERELLFKAIDMVRKNKLSYTIQTNGYWGQCQDERAAILDAIRDCSRLGISTDKFHQDYIDKNSVVATFKAAIDLGISSRLRYVYSMNEDKEQILTVLELKNTSYEPYVSFDELMAVGRAAKTMPIDYFPLQDKNAPCFAASIPTVCAGGEIYACCGESFNLPDGHALRLGNLNQQPIANIFASREKNSILQAIRTVGPIEMASKCNISDRNPFDTVLENSSCGSCRVMLSSQERQEEALRVSKVLSPVVKDLRALYYGELVGINTDKTTQ